MKTDAPVHQPVGPEVDAMLAKSPAPVKLQGRFGSLEKLDPSRVALDLWGVLKDRDDVWTYMSYGPFSDAGAFSNFMSGLAVSSDPYYYAIFDRDGRAQGWASLLRITPAMRVIEVGSIVYAPSLQRTPLATEVQYLLARYVFETLGYRRYEWKCDALNTPSRRAAERLGFTFEGIFRQHMIVKNRNRDTAWYAMLGSDWPRAKAAFEAWLSEENFDSEGRQRHSLAAFRSGS
jgi:RimJ/RimL family protein N-acetyltransferase